MNCAPAAVPAMAAVRCRKRRRLTWKFCFINYFEAQQVYIHFPARLQVLSGCEGSLALTAPVWFRAPRLSGRRQLSAPVDAACMRTNQNQSTEGQNTRSDPRTVHHVAQRRPGYDPVQRGTSPGVQKPSPLQSSMESLFLAGVAARRKVSRSLCVAERVHGPAVIGGAMSPTIPVCGAWQPL